METPRHPSIHLPVKNVADQDTLIIPARLVMAIQDMVIQMATKNHAPSVILLITPRIKVVRHLIMMPGAYLSLSVSLSWSELSFQLSYGLRVECQSLAKQFASSALMPIPAAALIDAFHHDTNIATLRVDDHAATQIESDMRFIVGICRAVAEQ